ncbi:MAG: hypothetical protein A2Z62_02035 [Candidatus Terrybacteria bacterium RIFCSPLOWO2_02_42_20]|uniref:Uncharacterized protein n=2 Tax=Candidatus Terryibacteriota TaxID=1817920 RepID=A0A1G2PKD5_9BACT|nr:MAG: hypothetical protein A2W59_00430 [Candidatus Terrybacteria bacterium RIFCSPHIGHO2_02_41_19]OHA53888.1 MAG: hypothetical protein A2Z62_02035 [Candidatus Terrybacteria bacterium RIFCSPLOWO2_02_42_20]
MTPLQEEKVRNICADIGSFAVVSNDEAAEEVCLAKEALAAAIKNAGLPVHSYPERKKDFAEKWVAILPFETGASAVFSTSILIPKNKIETKEISYTEDDRYVSINISAGKEEISKNNVVFKTLPAKVDAVFSFLPPDQENKDGKLPEEVSKKIIVAETDNIINLSSGVGEETLSEKVFSLIGIIESSGDISIKKSPVPDLVFAALMIETDQFQKNISGKTLALASSLLKLGADKEKIIAALSDKDYPFARLLGRAMARSYPNESLKSVWTFISDQDLEKTGNKQSPALFDKIMKKIKNLLESRPFFILIWQSKQEVWAMVSVSSRPERRDGQNIEEKLTTLLSAKKENGNLISGPYKNFSEAELKIQSALKKVA